MTCPSDSRLQTMTATTVAAAATDNWSSRLFRSLSRAPKRGRERSESRRGHHQDRSSTAGGHRRPLGDCDDVCDMVRRAPGATSTPGVRGRSRERQSYRRTSRRARSEPRPHRAARTATPEDRPRCNPASKLDKAGGDHHSSPQPPKIRARRQEAQDEHEEEEPHHQAVAEDSSATSPTTHAELSWDELLPSQEPATPASTTAAAGSTTPPMPAPPIAAENGQASPAATELQQQRAAPEQDSASAGVLEQEQASANFISTIISPIEQPLLHTCQQNQVKPRRTRKPPGKPTRRSARLAAIAWPMGHAQSRAQQILLKRLAIAQEGAKIKKNSCSASSTCSKVRSQAW